MKIILLAGTSASGKSTLANALTRRSGTVFSTSAFLRGSSGFKSADDLGAYGDTKDRENPYWLHQAVENLGAHNRVVVDAIRSTTQHDRFKRSEAVRINVTASDGARAYRMSRRGRQGSGNRMPYLFSNPDLVWDSERVSLSTMTNTIDQFCNWGVVDLIIGGQYGSEGKGKLAALLANEYDALVRSGGPNAGHWVRDHHYEFCFHHIPSGTLANRRARVYIAAGATIGPSFLDEVERTRCKDRLVVDDNAMIINSDDIKRESRLVDIIGSTAQGVGACTSRRILRGLDDKPTTAGEFMPEISGDVVFEISRDLGHGDNILIEGTQGSALSLFHGPYPYTTSRDTNSAGLLSEAGVPLSRVRDVWVVLRSFPIRVGGNSGPMLDETTWENIAKRTDEDPMLLKSKELTSTTRRQRRVGAFDWSMFDRMVRINNPNKLFLSFADYIHPRAAGVTDWDHLPDEVLHMVHQLELMSSAIVAGVSTGPHQRDVCWR